MRPGPQPSCLHSRLVGASCQPSLLLLTFVHSSGVGVRCLLGLWTSPQLLHGCQAALGHASERVFASKREAGSPRGWLALGWSWVFLSREGSLFLFSFLARMFLLLLQVLLPVFVGESLVGLLQPLVTCKSRSHHLTLLRQRDPSLVLLDYLIC